VSWSFSTTTVGISAIGLLMLSFWSCCFV
jgi:hypothetical protein